MIPNVVGVFGLLLAVFVYFTFCGILLKFFYLPLHDWFSLNPIRFDSRWAEYSLVSFMCTFFLTLFSRENAEVFFDESPEYPGMSQEYVANKRAEDAPHQMEVWDDEDDEEREDYFYDEYASDF